MNPYAILALFALILCILIVLLVRGKVSKRTFVRLGLVLAILQGRISHGSPYRANLR